MNKIIDIYFKVVIAYFILNVCLFHSLFKDENVKYVALVSLVILVIYKISKSYSIKISKLVIISIWLMMILLNFWIAPDNSFIASYLIYYALVPMFFFVLFSRCVNSSDNNMHKKFFENKIVFLILNIFSVANLVVTLLQINGSQFMISNYDETKFVHYDQISGFFGLNGTPNWMLFAVFIILYNYNYSKCSGINSKKIKILSVIMMLAYCLEALFNDSKGLFLMYFIFLLPIILKNIKIIKISIKKIFFTFLIFVLIVLICLTDNPIKEIFTDKIIPIIFSPIIETKEVYQENERIDLFIYALENLKGWKFGLGLGFNWDMYLLPRHFGISDLSNLTAHGGVWYYILWILTDTYIFKTKNRKQTIYIMFCFIFITMYTNIVSSWQLMILCGMVFMELKQLLMISYRNKINIDY